jgi:hypothetical protein
VLLVDQAGWHLSGRLIVPSSITPIPFPAECPELNPQENIWQFLRDNSEGMIRQGCLMSLFDASQQSRAV